jgi:hypothetical protein
MLDFVSEHFGSLVVAGNDFGDGCPFIVSVLAGWMVCGCA